MDTDQGTVESENRFSFPIDLDQNLVTSHIFPVTAYTHITHQPGQEPHSTVQHSHTHALYVFSHNTRLLHVDAVITSPPAEELA